MAIWIAFIVVFVYCSIFIAYTNVLYLFDWNDTKNYYYKSINYAYGLEETAEKAKRNASSYLLGNIKYSLILVNSR